MRQRIKASMARVFNLPVDAIPDDAVYGRLPGWDSLGHIALMMDIEAEFGLDLTTDILSSSLTLASLEELLRTSSKRSDVCA